MTKTDDKTKTDKSSDEPDQSSPILKPKFGNPNSFRNQNADKKGNQTFSQRPVNIVRHKG